MALIVEDGSIVDNANSYVTLAEFRTYAATRGVTLPNNDEDAEAILIKAMDYFESYGDRFKGTQVTRDQPLSWPRSGAVIEGWTWSSSEIPRQVISAQLALGIESASGEDLFNPSAAALPVTRERVEGAVEVEYANPTRVSKVTKTAPSQTIINLLLNRSGLFAIRV